jgi:azurin
MKRLISLTFALVLTVAWSGAVHAQAARTINLTGSDTLQFSLKTITAKPGERLTVVLRTMSMQPASQMAHNFIILKPGANVDKFVMAAGMAKDQGYMPKALLSQVLVATDMAAANETVKATFTAPTKPGTYTYFCSYPAHFNGGMKGTLIVK